MYIYYAYPAVPKGPKHLANVTKNYKKQAKL